MTLEGDVSDFDASFQLDLRQANADLYGLTLDRVDLGIASGSVIITVTVYATPSLSVSDLDVVATSTFTNATAAAAFILAGTGQLVVVTAIDVTTTTPIGPGGDTSGSSSGLSGGAIAGIVIGVIAGVLIMAALVYFLMKGQRSSVPEYSPNDALMMKSKKGHAPAAASNKAHGYSKKAPPGLKPDGFDPLLVAHSDGQGTFTSNI